MRKSSPVLRFGFLIFSFISFNFVSSTVSSAQCWKMPEGRSLEELSLMSTVKRDAQFSRQFMPAAILLSNGDPRDLKTAYGAGLILGWGQTGRRPEFHVVTAVGVSALIAPFVFIGKHGDQALGEIYNCNAGSVKDMADRAISFVTDDIVAMIARRHSAGRRLIIAIPGSPARAETIWDLGLIAVSDHPHKVAIIGMLLNAAADHTTAISPDYIGISAGKSVDRNRTFLYEGAGNSFFLPREEIKKSNYIYIIENGVREADLSRKYASMRQGKTPDNLSQRELLTTYDLANILRGAGKKIRYASINPERVFYRTAPFDFNYIRSLFMFSFRQGRMGLEWKQDIIDIHRIKR